MSTLNNSKRNKEELSAMAFLITDANNVVVYHGPGATIVSNGIEAGGNIFAGKNLKLHEVDNLPSGNLTQEYCYTKELGLYENEAYMTPIRRQFNDLIDDISDLTNILLAKFPDLNSSPTIAKLKARGIPRQ